MPWPDEPPRKVLSPGLAEAIIFHLNLARAPWSHEEGRALVVPVSRRLA